MFFFTKQERTVLFLFTAVLCAGSLLQAAFSQYPNLADIVNLIDSDRIYSKVDINTATFEELVSIPYIGEYTASGILRYRRENGPFWAFEQVKRVKGIREKNFKRFAPYLKRITRQ